MIACALSAALLMTVVRSVSAVPSASPSVVRTLHKHRPQKRKRPATKANRRKPAWGLVTLAMRHELLRDFLVESGSEQPAFTDTRVLDLGKGIRIGPASVDTDFLGSPIVRARVVNSSSRSVDVLVTATVRDAHGTSARVATWVEGLAPGSARSIELACPAALTPTSLTWTMTDL